MLDNLANKFQTTVLFVLVAMLVAVFVLQFGGGQAEGCTAGGSTLAATVRGRDVSLGDFRAAYMMAGFHQRPIEQQRAMGLRETVLNGVVDRILLAHDARELGMIVSGEEAMTHIITEDTFFLTLGRGASPYMPQGELRAGFQDENGRFDREHAERVIRNYLRRSVGEFAQWQAEEMMAERMREMIRASVTVSDAEVWEAYVQERDAVKVRYVQFREAYYRDEVEVSEEGLTAFLAEHEEEVDEEYQRNRHRYTGLPPQVRVRQVLISADAQAGAEEREAARERAEAALARIEGGEDFALVAREASDDRASSRRGGDLGWVPEGRLPEPVSEAAFALEAGQISGVVESPIGYHVLRVEGHREGDVPEDVAKREVSERLFREGRAEERVREAATEALSLARDEGMEALEERLLAEAGDDEERMPLAPRVTVSQLFGREDDPVRGPFDGGVFVREAFELTEESPLLGEPLQLGSDFFVIELVERRRPTQEDFDAATQRRLHNSLLIPKEQAAVDAYAASVRDRAEAAGEVIIYPDALSYGDDESETGGES